MSDQPDEREEEPEGNTPTQPPADSQTGTVLDSIRAVHGPDAQVSVDLQSPDAAVAEPLPDAPVCARTPRYSVASEIARGGMGAIFKVRDQDLRRNLAMKVLLGSGGVPGGPVKPECLNRFLEEAQVTAQLAHPGVVPVHELGIDAEGRVFFTMSLVRGKTLSQVTEFARAGTDGWSMTRALQVILRVCETMAFAHDKGVIHRDLKPANVMVGKFGETYVMDWGLAKVTGHQDRHDIRLKDLDLSTLSNIESRRAETTSAHDSPIMTMDGAVVGTPAYMPPEQARGRVEEVDAQSDVYAIGAMLYELLTGQAPYVARGDRVSPHTVLLAVHSGPPTPVHEVDAAAPEELQAICEKAMSRDRARRYATAMNLGEELQRFLSGHVVRAHRTGAVIELKKWVARNKGVAATAAAALVVMAGVTGYFLDSLASERKLAIHAKGRAEVAAAEADTERNAKDAALRESERLLRRARALGLAGASRQEAERNPSLALLLAREAVRADTAPEAVSRLHSAIAKAYEVRTIDVPVECTTVAFAGRGDRLVCADRTGRVALRDLEGQWLGEITARPGEWRGVHVSPAGDTVLAVDWADQAELRTLDGQLLLRCAAAFDPAFSPAGDLLVAPAGNGANGVDVWHTTGTVAHEIGRDLPGVTDATFLHGGSHVLAFARESDMALLVDLRDGGQTRVKLPDGTVRVAALGPRAGFLGVGQESVTILSLSGGEPQTLEPGERIWRARATADGDFVVLRGLRNHSLWRTSTGDRVWQVEGSYGEPEPSPAGAQVAVQTTTPSWGVTIRNSDGKTEVAFPTATRPADHISWHPSGRKLVSAHDDSTVRIWDLDNSEAGRYAVASTAIVASAISHDAERVALAARDGTVQVLDDAGDRIGSFAAKAPVKGITFSPLGNALLVRTASDEVLLCDRDGASRHRLAHYFPATIARFSPDASLVVTAEEGRAHVWNADGTKLHTLPLPGTDVLDVRFTLNGGVITATRDGRTRFWSPTGELERSIPREDPGRLGLPIPTFAALIAGDSRLVRVYEDHVLVSAPDGNAAQRIDFADGEPLALLPDLGKLVIGGVTPRTLDLATGRSTYYSGHVQPVNDFDVSTPDARLLTASSDGSARLWLLDGTEVAAFEHPCAVMSCAFLGVDFVVTGGEDGVHRIWFVKPDALLARADERAPRSWTREERERFGGFLGAENDAVVAAKRWLDDLDASLILPADVIATAAADGSLSPPVRNEIAGIAEARTQEPWRVVQAALAAVAPNDVAPEAAQRAYLAATDAAARLPKTPFTILTRALAALRAGRPHEALALLADPSIEKIGLPIETVGIRVLALAALGREDEAAGAFVAAAAADSDPSRSGWALNTLPLDLSERLGLEVLEAAGVDLESENFNAARRDANETATIATLRNVTSAQAQLKYSALIDADGDGIGEYGTFSELSGRVGGRTLAPDPSPGGRAQSDFQRRGRAAQPALLSSAFRRVDEHGFVVRSGYVFRIFLPDAGASQGFVHESFGGGQLRLVGGTGTVDVDRSETSWIIYAHPVEFGVSGRRRFFASHTGDILASSNDDRRVQGIDASAPGHAALQGTTFDSSPAADAESTSGERWVILN